MEEEEDELEAIRRRRVEEIQRAQAERMVRDQQEEQVKAQREMVLRQILSPEARERLARIELAYPEVTENIENQLIVLAQSGRVNKVIDDATLRDILRRIMPQKRDIKIERR